MHISDFTQEENQVVLDLINFDNQSNLTLEQVTLGNTGPVQNGKVSISVTSLAGSGYSGTQTVQYGRIPVNQLFDVYYPDRMVIQRDGKNLVSDFLDQINLSLAINISPSDIDDEPLPAPTNVPAQLIPVTLEMKPSSKVYEGSVLFNVRADNVQMSSIITIPTLGGLNLPEPPESIDPSYFINFLRGDVLNGF